MYLHLQAAIPAETGEGQGGRQTATGTAGGGVVGWTASSQEPFRIPLNGSLPGQLEIQLHICSS